MFMQCPNCHKEVSLDHLPQVEVNTVFDLQCKYCNHEFKYLVEVMTMEDLNISAKVRNDYRNSILGIK